MIAEPSVQSLFLVAMGNGRELGTGTGFVVQHNDHPYLVTNYHVAAGRSPHDGQPLHPSAAVPDTLRMLQLMPVQPNRIQWAPATSVSLRRRQSAPCGSSTQSMAEGWMWS